MLDGPKRGTDTLSAGTLEYRKLKDLNETTHAEGTVIRAAEFHPHAAVALVAGLNGAASLFKVDGRSNPKIQTVNFQNFPIRTAHFSSSGHQFFAGSQHFPHYFVYDLNAGKTLKVESDLFLKWLTCLSVVVCVLNRSHGKTATDRDACTSSKCRLLVVLPVT